MESITPYTLLASDNGHTSMFSRDRTHIKLRGITMKQRFSEKRFRCNSGINGIGDCTGADTQEYIVNRRICGMRG